MRRLGIDLDGDGDTDRDDLRLLTIDQAADIFLEHYFRKPRIAELATRYPHRGTRLRASVFDMTVNAGANGVRILQKLVNRCSSPSVSFKIKPDGKIGRRTIAAVEQIAEKGIDDLASAYAIAPAKLLFQAGRPETDAAQILHHREGPQSRLDPESRGISVAGRTYDGGGIFREDAGMVAGGWLGKIFGASIGGVGDAAVKVASVFTTNKEADAQRQAVAADRDANMVLGAQQQFAREFHRPTNLFDSIINGVNRLPRAVMAMSTIAMLWLAFLDPLAFVAGANGLTLIPIELWAIVGAVFTFYFGGGFFLDRKRQVITAEHAAKTLDTIKEIKALRPPPPPPPRPPDYHPDTPEIDQHEHEDGGAEDQAPNAPADRLRALFTRPG